MTRKKVPNEGKPGAHSAASPAAAVGGHSIYANKKFGVPALPTAAQSSAAKDAVTRKAQAYVRARDADGLTPQMADFARLYGTGECRTMADAYRRSYKAGGSDKCASDNASRLAADPRVLASIHRHRDRTADQNQRDAEFTRSYITTQLYRVIDNPNTTAKDRLAALSMLGQRSDVVYDAPHRVETTRTIKRSDVEARLDAILVDYSGPRLVKSVK